MHCIANDISTILLIKCVLKQYRNDYPDIYLYIIIDYAFNYGFKSFGPNIKSEL